MTRDEIIEMARQAGFFIIANSPDLFSKLVAFANLVAAKEREALAQEQEPSGHFLDFAYSDSIAQVHVYDQFQKGQQFYTTPPQRTWVGLTPTDRGECLKAGHDQGWTGVMEATQAKLKEKNK